MSPDKSRELISIYPELFSNDHPLIVPLMFGFECGDGWFELLKDLISELKCLSQTGDLTQSFGFDDEPVSLNVDQVKEKYGTLRFYTNWQTDEVDKAIKRAEEHSAVTCEECGKPGILRQRGAWCYTSCQEHVWPPI